MAGIQIKLDGNFAKLNELRTKVSQTMKQIRTGFTERIGHRGLDMALSTIQRIPELMKAAVDAASDFQESGSKINEIFRDSAGTIVSWSEQSADAMGMSQNAALGAAGSIGNLFKAMGLAEGAVLSMSQRSVELASDLASFNNTTPEDAIEAIGAALRGEAEPIRRYGVLLDDATLKAKAFAMGIHEGKGSLAPATRALAAYNVILEQTTSAQGDFARTSDGFANSQRQITASMQDGLQELGTALLPLVQEAANVLKDVDMRAVAGGLVSVVDGVRSVGEALLETQPLWHVFRHLASENDDIIAAFDEMDAAREKFDSRVVASSATTRGEISAKLSELAAERAALEDAMGEVIAKTTDADDAALLAKSLETTTSRMRAQEEAIAAITDAQLVANQAKAEAIAKEAEYAEAIAKSAAEAKKARQQLDAANAKAEEKRIGSLGLNDQLDALDAKEAALRGSLGGGVSATIGGLSANEMAARLQRATDAGAPDDGKTLSIIGEIFEIEQRRAEILAEIAKTEKDTAEARAAALAEYEEEMAVLDARISGSAEILANAEREAAIRAEINRLMAVGYSEAEATEKAGALVAKRELAAAAAEEDARRLESMKDEASRLDKSFGSSLLAVDSMQRIGGGGGVATVGFDYARQQVDELRRLTVLTEQILAASRNRLD